jgi:DNA-binding NtrC family response regulator
MNKRNILIVDDEPTQCKVLTKFINDLGHNPITMMSGMEVVDFFMNKKVVKGVSCHDIDVMLLDLSMPDLDGLTVLKQIAPIKGDLQIIVLTASQDVNLVVTAINYCAIDYIVKGERDIFARVTASINNAIEKKNLKYQVSHLARKNKDKVAFSDVIGQSEALINSINLAKKAVNSTIPILIEGPNGSGKELLARAIHGSSSRSGKPFIIVECDIIKNEEDLFGSDKAVVDGSVKNIGKLREANSGTIFFEKIDMLRPELQSRLLRFIQDGEIILPNRDPIKINIKIISSAIRDLKKQVIAKKFREDLQYRLSAFPISMPSLRERGEEDIKSLAENFCRDFSINENKKIKSISGDALYLLYNYEWEDNVRQLRNSIFRAVVLCDGDTLRPEHFPQLLNKENNNITKAKAVIKKSSDVNSELVDIFDDEGKCKTMDTIEEEVIRRIVDIHNGNMSEVAKQLEIGRSTIYRKLKLLNEGSEDEKS